MTKECWRQERGIEGKQKWAVLDMSLWWKARKTGILPSSLNLVPFLNPESLSKKYWNVTWVWWWWCHQTGFLLIVSSQRFELWTEGSEHSCVPLGLTSHSPWWATCSSCAQRHFPASLIRAEGFCELSGLTHFFKKILQWSFIGSTVFFQI